MTQIERLSSKAVEYAVSFQKNLDYSVKSICDLEEILNYYAEDLKAARPTENQIWSMALIFGSYLGQSMLNNGLLKSDFKWIEEQIPYLSDPAGRAIAPVDKVYKRLTNGAVDNVCSFYDFAMDFAQKT